MGLSRFCALLSAALVSTIALSACTDRPTSRVQESTPSSRRSTTPPVQTEPRPLNLDGPLAVTRVVDGDTIKVSTGITLRLIGIDTPETVDPRKPVQCFGREASNHAHQLLDKSSVSLEFDPTQGRLDRYGRTLAYVWMSDGRMFNELMIADGYAHEYTYDLPYRYQDQFIAAERAARDAPRGLWSPSTCAGDTNTPAGG